METRGYAVVTAKNVQMHSMWRATVDDTNTISIHDDTFNGFGGIFAI